MIGDNNKIQIEKINKGFTLIEILVAISVFILMSSIFTRIFIVFVNNQARSNSSQELLNNTSYIMEIMAREIKNNEIDYNFMIPGGLCNDNVSLNCIVLKRPDGSLVAFSRSSGEPDRILYGPLTCTSYPTVCDVNSSDRVVITSPDLNSTRIDYLQFLVTPATADPYQSQTINQQPRVTISLKTTFYSNKPIERISYNLQTTVSSRIYKR